VVVGDHRNFRFGEQVDHIKSLPMDHLKGAWSCHAINCKFFSPPQNVSGMAKVKDFKYCTLIAHMKY